MTDPDLALRVELCLWDGCDQNLLPKSSIIDLGQFTTQILK